MLLWVVSLVLGGLLLVVSYGYGYGFGGVFSKQHVKTKKKKEKVKETFNESASNIQSEGVNGDSALPELVQTTLEGNSNSTLSDPNEHNTKGKKQPKMPKQPKKPKEPKVPLTPEEMQIRKIQKEKRKRERDEAELAKLREETTKYHQEQEQLKSQQQRIIQLHTFVKKKKTELEIQAQKEENLRRRQAYLQEERRLKEEEELKKLKKVAPPVQKKVIPSAWGVVNGSNDGVSLKEIQEETKKLSQNDGQDIATLNYRRERQQRRKDIEVNLERMNACRNTYEERVQKLKYEMEKKFREIDKKVQSLILVEKKNLLWKDPTQFKIDEFKVGRLQGIISDFHSLIVGEKGTNISVLRCFNVNVNVSFSSTDPITLRGNEKEIRIAYDKIKQILQWKYYKDEAKNQSALRAKSAEDVKVYQVQKNPEKVKEANNEFIIHEHLQQWAESLANEFCIKFHNDEFERNQVDLRGLKEADAISYAIRRILEIESMKPIPWNNMQIILGTESLLLSNITKEIISYLKQYAFRFTWLQEKGTIQVQL